MQAPSPDAAPSPVTRDQLQADSNQLELQTTITLLNDIRTDVQFIWQNLVSHTSFEVLSEREAKVAGLVNELVVRAHSIATKVPAWTSQALVYASRERLEDMRKELDELNAKQAALQAAYDDALRRALLPDDAGLPLGPRKVAAQVKK